MPSDIYRLLADYVVLLTAAVIIGKLVSGAFRAELSQLRRDFDEHKDDVEANQRRLLTEVAFLKGQLSGLPSRLHSAISNGENSRP